MSALSLNVYVKSDHATATAAIRTFVTHVNAGDYASIKAMDVEQTLYDVEDVLASAITLNEDGELLHLLFESARSLEVDGLVAFFKAVGGSAVEVSAFDSGTGESFYVDTRGEHFDHYADGNWQWLPRPSEGFVGEHVVVTGRFNDYSRTALEALIRKMGGTIQTSINGKTTLLVAGAKPGADKTSKAQALGIARMDEEQLLALLAQSGLLQADNSPEPLTRVYQSCFAPSEPPIAWLPTDIRAELYAVLHANGYLTDDYYQGRLETARAWSPAVAANYKAYAAAKDIPMAERGPLNPRKASEIASIFSAHRTLLDDDAHFAWEPQTNGYAHALAQIALHTGMPLQHIDCVPAAACKASVTLSCVFEGKPYSASFEPSPNAFPKPFIRLLHAMAAASDTWDFIVHGRAREQGYVLMPHTLTQAFVRFGFLKPLDSLVL